MAGRNPNRGIVLRLDDAFALHRWLEFLMDDRRFFNPIEAMEAKRAAEDAKDRLGQKCIDVCLRHREEAHAD